jgi:hypothetical protein
VSPPAIALCSLRPAAAFIAAIAVGSFAPGRASAFCRAGVDSTSEGECREDAEVPRLRWSPRACSAYAFGASFFERLGSISERAARGAFEDAFLGWSAVDCGREPFLVEQLPHASERDDVGFEWDERNESLIVARDAEEWAKAELDPDAIALTLVFHDPDTGEIYDVDMQLNTGAGEFTACAGTCDRGQIDLHNTIAHESGHYLGLGHSDVLDATMAPYAGRGDAEQISLAADDEDGYCALRLPSFACRGDDCTCPPPPAYARVPPTLEPQPASCSAHRKAESSAASVWAGWLALLSLIGGCRRLRAARVARHSQNR